MTPNTTTLPSRPMTCDSTFARRYDNSREELDLFRAQVNCAAVLENLGQPWRMDKGESTRRALKYRRHPGEVLIVSHEGRGWWDPQSSAKGNVFTLIRHLDPGLNFGQVRQTLRRFVGITPTFQPAETRQARPGAEQPVTSRWAARPALRPGTAAWQYLAVERALPAALLNAAIEQDAIRAGAYDCAWFAHRDEGQISHVEIRGASFKGSLKGGHKILFRLRGGQASPTRLVIAEAPIDALSRAAIEQIRQDTLYVATGGGMGPGTLQALKLHCADLATRIGASVESAADGDAAGDRYADRHAEIASAAGITFNRLRPPDGLDWNAVAVRARAASGA